LLQFSQPVIWSYLSVRHTPSLSTPWADQGNQACQPQMNAENTTTPEIEVDEETLDLLVLAENWQEQELVALWQDDEFGELEDGEDLEW